MSKLRGEKMSSYYVEITRRNGGACVWTGCVQADNRLDAEIVALEAAKIRERYWDSFRCFVKEI